MSRLTGLAIMAAFVGLFSPRCAKAQELSTAQLAASAVAAVQDSASSHPLSFGGYTLGENIAIHNSATIADCLVTRRRGLTKAYYAKCDGLAAAVNQGGRWTAPDGATYEKGSLVRFETLVDEPNDVVFANAVSQFGVPTMQAYVADHAITARWRDRVSEWDLPVGSMMLYENNDPSGGGKPTVVLQAKTEHAEGSKTLEALLP